jgi:septal ring factor EnvC (AmiA/AmiB activator)
MEILALVIWPVTLCFIAHCIYATYAQAQKDQAYQLNAEIARLRQELANKYDKNISNCYEKIDSLEEYIANLEAKITVIQNGLQWNKK